MAKLSIAELTLVACITKKKLMIGMRAMRHHFYLKSAFYGTLKFALTLYFCEPLLIIVEENRSMRNIKQ